MHSPLFINTSVFQLMTFCDHIHFIQSVAHTRPRYSEDNAQLNFNTFMHQIHD